MTLPIYVVDAFAEARFAGNPAAVCPLETWLPDAVMQAIAAENNLSETAFFVRSDAGYDLRWFTPAKEVDLCGHATLGSAFVISTYLDPEAGRMVFLEPNSGGRTAGCFSCHQDLRKDGLGWILASVGAIVLASYGLWEAVTSMLADTSVPWFLKLAFFALGAGAIVLFVSALREKLFTRKHDPYKEVER